MFKYYHKIHHSHLDEAYNDPDLACPMEIKLFGGTVIGKIIWITFNYIIQSGRIFGRTAEPILLEFLFNIVACFGVNG